MISAADSILLRSPNWLGDAVLTLPAVQQLSASGLRPAVLCPEKLRDFWQLIPGVKEILTVQRKPLATAKMLRPKKFDAAILFPNSLTTAIEVFAAGIPKRYGFRGHHRRWLLTQSWPRPSQTKGYIHQARQNLALLQHLGMTASGDFKPIPKPAPADGELFTKSYIAVCPGAEYGPAKRWPAARYAAVINRLRAADPQLDAVILGAAGDTPVAERLAIQCAKKITDLTGRTTLAEFLAILAHARLALVNDSGAMHAAAMFGTPAVAIFGSTEPRLTGPLSGSVTVIRDHVPCSPCFLRDCPLDLRCLLSVSADSVAAACVEKLQRLLSATS